ncbi:DUF7133 domain-containing protein [Roseiconus nitratireducens]|nr:hypothetical protein [Roseiconus nitratireducens]
MNRLDIVWPATLLWTLCVTTVLGQPPNAQRQTVGGIEFQVRDGLTIQKVAAEPLIKWPIVVDWDRQGRLVVAESGGVGWPIQEHNQLGLHHIVRLVDDDDDGVFDRRIVAASGLAFPEGVLCLDNDILVSAPPVIWRLTDADDDGICEQREVWFDGTTVTNCANDLHGPYLGPDGWIYWCKGAFGKQTHELTDGRTVTNAAAHIYRRHRSGGPIESVISGGMDNPVEVAFTPEGEAFFTSTFLVRPGNGQRDGIGHAVENAVFGKQNHVVDEVARTGPLMQPMTHLGPAAPSGLICPQSPACKRLMGVPPESNVLAAALFNLHKLSVHQLQPDGATYQTVDQDLVWTDRVDFHPTDLIEDSDGSLLLVDTGGWYDLCCPTSRIDQKTASGGIYRLSREDQRRDAAPDSRIDWQALTPAKCVDLLLDDRPWVRRHAALRLASADAAVIPRLLQIASDQDRARVDRQAALWALCRLESAPADEAMLEFLTDADPGIVQTALHALAIRRVSIPEPKLQILMDHPSALVRRCALEAVGRVADANAVDLLLGAFQSAQGDRHLEHAALDALIQTGRRDPAIAWMRYADTDTKQVAALTVLQQLDRANQLDTATLLSALRSDHAALRSIATQILADDPAAAAAAMENCTELWRTIPDSQPAASTLHTLVSSWKDTPEIKTLVGSWLGRAAELPESQQRFLATNLAKIVSQPPDRETATAITTWLTQATETIHQELLDQLGEISFGPHRNLLSKCLQQQALRVPEIVDQLTWLSPMPQGSAIDDSDLESAVVQAFVSRDAEQAFLAAKVLHRTTLSQPGASQLLQSLPEVTPRHLMTAIETIHRSGDSSLDQQLLQSLTSIRSARTLPEGFLQQQFKQASPSIRQRAERVGRELIQAPADIRTAVTKVLSDLGPGDPVRGLQIFRGNKAACSACHKMGYLGKDVGPELTRIGRSRTREALLEAILFPSARLEQSYQSTRLLTVDGNVHNGLIRDRSGGMLTLQINADRTLTLPRDQIELESPSETSVMPSGLGELLTQQELADLIALLESAK